MADPRFHHVQGPFSLLDLATLTDSDVANSATPEALYSDVAPLDKAEADSISFIDNKMYVEAFTKSRAGACVAHPSMAEKAPDGMALILNKDPYRAYAKIARAFYPAVKPAGGISPKAHLDEMAVIGDGCQIEPGAVIGSGAKIGEGCYIGPNAVIGSNVEIADHCWIGANVTLGYCLIGENCIIHGGVHIGQDGFGFAMGPEGHLKVPQLGRVLVGDDVEIGANSTIDRGTGPDTVIGDGTKIDNLVQIGHNVKIGRCCVIVSQVGISGSTELGDFAVLAGQVGLAGHLKIGTGAQIAAQSGVMRDVPAGQKYGGSPAQPVRDWMRGVAMMDRLVRKKT